MTVRLDVLGIEKVRYLSLLSTLKSMSRQSFVFWIITIKLNAWAKMGEGPWRRNTIGSPRDKTPLGYTKSCSLLGEQGILW